VRTMLKAVVFFNSFFSITSIVHAQSESTKHVFPQIVDGVQADGSVFTSRVWIASIGGFPASCSLSLYGFGPERLTTSASVVVQPSSFVTISTRGQDAVADGYARLDCSQPVFASLTYFLQEPNSKPLGMATVTGTPATSRALIPMVLNGRYRYGIAIANDNDAPLLVALSLTSSPTSPLLPLQLQPRSQYVKFIDEIFNLPAEGLATFEILANGSVGSDNFNVTELLFDGGTFTTLVPATIH
jgi:hypothetical protein